MKKINLVRLIIVFLFIPKIGLGQGADPRTEGQYTDYTTINMPESPTASAFNIVDDIQMNPTKGVPIISIPIYTYEVDGVQVPISLSYDASGIKVAQMATSVGLGWSLVAGGQISRTVRSKPDEEFDYGWFYKGYIRKEYYADKDPTAKSWQEIMKGTQLNFYKGLVALRDHNPDVFSYSLPQYSGSYIHDTNMSIIKEQNDKLSILPFGNSDDNLDARDFEGNYYYFDYEDTEQSSDEIIFHTGNNLQLDHYKWENSNFLPIVTAWKLSRITGKNGKEIIFNYGSEYMEYTFSHQQSQLTTGKDCDNLGLIGSTMFTNTTHRYTTRLLEEISSPHSNIKVEFEYETDNGMDAKVWKRKLTKITIRDIISNEKREFHFEYGRFSGDPRLRLESIQEMAYENGSVITKPPYLFAYQSGDLPAKDSKGQDLYGYYNLKDNNNGMIPNVFNVLPDQQTFYNTYSGDRSLNTTGLKRGILTQITYPTGGKTEFSYEPNVENLSNLVGYRGGLRVKEIKNFDENNNLASRRTYEYNELQGEDFQADILRFFKKDEGNSKTFFTSPMRLPGDWGGYRTGYFYGKVNMVSHGNTTNENFRTEYKYIQNHNNKQSYEPVLESETIFEGTTANRLKIIEYEYDVISDSGDSEIIEWWVVGDMDCFYLNPPYFPPSANNHVIGYSTTPRKIQFSGNYAYLPTRIATTEFLKRGGTFEPITVLKDITYDPQTLLKKQEIIDTRYQRQENSPGNITYALYDANASYIITDYTYPFEVSDYNSLPTFPKGLVIKQETTTHKGGTSIQTAGRAFAFDDYGNIKTVYGFSQGQGSNNSSLSYVPGTYEELTNFIYSDGYPVQVEPYKGTPTSYIWNKKSNTLVAKIEGRPISGINSGLVSQLENATYGQLPSLLSQLRTSLLGQSHPPFVTTYTYKPLAGVATITDPKNQIITYEYDVFGRLESVKDLEGNLVEEYEYNYSNN